jgi:hypothetical protein
MTPYWKRRANKAMEQLADTYQMVGACDGRLNEKEEIVLLDALSDGTHVINGLVGLIEKLEGAKP